MTTWFIADTHFGQQPQGRKKVTGMTGDELDALMERLWRERVGPDDIVWHLGDIGPDIARLGTLPGRKYVIKGNNDPAPSTLLKTGLFKDAFKEHVLHTDTASLFLIHIPCDPPKEGLSVIHGHTHADDPLPGHRSVSVDRTGWAPITLEDLLARGS